LKTALAECGKMKKLIALGCSLGLVTLLHAQQISDVDLKKDIAPLTGSLKKLIQLKPISFNYDTQRFKHLALASTPQYGFIADEVQNIFPQLVSERHINYVYGKNVYRDAAIPQVDQAALIPVLVQSVKELHAEIEKLKEEIRQLKAALH
jgi:uncharacterized small protein (DUF1192 family)